MSTRLKWLLPVLALSAVGFVYKQRVLLVSLLPHSLHASGEDEYEACALPATVELPAGVKRTPGIHRSGLNPSGTQPPAEDSTDSLAGIFNLTQLSIPRDEIITLLGPDSIPALTDPRTEVAESARWLPDEARVIEVQVGGEVLGVPLRVLDWHEIVNTTLGGEPIAVTYCPLCDSATVFSRRVAAPRPPFSAGEESAADSPPLVLEFGVSGSLYNSNVLMYDRTHKGLWSQLGMRAVSGPLSGTVLEMLPVRVVSLAAFKQAHPGAPIVSRKTGHTRDYSRSPYESYFQDDRLMVPVRGEGEALSRKTLGVGVAIGSGESEQAWFVPRDAIGESFTLRTSAGDVVLSSNEAGVAVVEAPDGASVRTAQTFYFSWSAFYPKTKLLTRESAEARTSPGRTATALGLRVGQSAPDVRLYNVEGEAVELGDLWAQGPLVLTFYRGGWCPFCSQALAQWQSRLEDVAAAGGTFVAVTPEKRDLIAATVESKNLTYEVLSDPSLAAAKSFNIHFLIDDDTRAKYLKAGLDVAAANSSGAWELPVPATFVIDRSGVIRFAFADWDYTKRADPDEVIGVLRLLTDSN